MVNLSRKILEELEELAQKSSVREYSGYISTSAFFKAETLSEVKERVEKTLKKLSENGELISLEICSGMVVDTGRESFKIAGGKVYEYYHYETMTSLFIRLYRIEDKGKSWIALYIDENPHSPWWAEERAENLYSKVANP